MYLYILELRSKIMIFSRKPSKIDRYCPGVSLGRADERFVEAQNCVRTRIKSWRIRRGGGTDESKGRESTKRCECGGQFLIRCRERLDEGVHKTAATTTTTTTIAINNSGNSNANVHVLSPMIRMRNTTFAIGRAKGVWSRE